VGYIVAALGAMLVMAMLSLFAIQVFNHTALHSAFWKIYRTGIVLCAGAAVVIAVGAVVVWFLGNRVSHGTRICACLCIPYMMKLFINAVAYTIPTFYGFYFGYTLSLLVIVGCLIEITTLAVMAFRRGGK